MVKNIKAFFLKFQSGVNKTILFFSYFLVLGPISVYVRLTNHVKLPQFFENAQSTWLDIHSRKSDPDDYLKQH